MCPYHILNGAKRIDTVYVRLSKGRPIPASTVRKLLIAAGKCTADCTVTR